MTKLFEVQQHLKQFPEAPRLIERLDRMVNAGYTVGHSQMLEVATTLKALLEEKKPLTILEESLVLMQIANYMGQCSDTGFRE
jgi:hypothetical protein